MVLAGLVFYVGNQFFNELPLLSRNMRYNTVLQDASGVVEGSAVFVSGVRVGSVTKVSLDTEGVRIRFDARNDALVTQGSTVSIGGFRSLGDLRLELALGPPSAPRLSRDATVPYTATNILDDVAAGIPEMAASIDSLIAQSTQTMTAAHHLVTDPSGEVLSALQSFQRTADELQTLLSASGPRIERVLVGADSMVSTMDQVLGDSVATLLTEMQDLLEGLDTTLIVVADAATSADELFRTMLYGEGSVAG